MHAAPIGMDDHIGFVARSNDMELPGENVPV